MASTDAGARRNMRAFLAVISRVQWTPRTPLLVIVAAIALFIMVYPVPVSGQQQHSNPWLLTWIGKECCVTNDCCFRVTARDLHSLPDDKWRVVASGQVLSRTNYSPDGLFYRCACDYDTAAGKWVVHDRAHTRCVFVPLQSM